MQTADHDTKSISEKVALRLGYSRKAMFEPCGCGSNNINQKSVWYWPPWVRATDENDDNKCDYLPDFATQLDQAWSMIAAPLRKYVGIYTTLRTTVREKQSKGEDGYPVWEDCVECSINSYVDPADLEVKAEANSPALAICLAFLQLPEEITNKLIQTRLGTEE